VRRAPLDKDAQNSARREQSFAAPSEGADAPTEGVLRIGVVSDTHGYLDPDIVDLFAGVNLIVHAGDVGDSEIQRPPRSTVEARQGVPRLWTR